MPAVPSNVCSVAGCGRLLRAKLKEARTDICAVCLKRSRFAPTPGGRAVAYNAIRREGGAEFGLVASLVYVRLESTIYIVHADRVPGCRLTLLPSQGAAVPSAA
jgi:hypothetical protein